MHQGGEIIGPRVERGLGYVALGPAEETLAFLQCLAASHRPYLWITDRASTMRAEGGRVLRVTTAAGQDDTIDPKRLGGLRTAAAAFVSTDDSGLVILDCLEYLVLHNGAERVLRALADLHDEVTMNGGSLIVLVDVRIANPRLVAWLERELDALPIDEASAGQVDIVSA